MISQNNHNNNNMTRDVLREIGEYQVMLWILA